MPVDSQGRILPTESFGSEIECFQSAPAPAGDHEFCCRFPRCNARYQRKEHLNRHERSKHIRQRSLICPHCGGEFRRSDTLRRHIQRLHKIQEPPKRAPKACVVCHKGKTRCEGGVPCEECVRRNVQCSFQDAGPAAEQHIRSSTTSPVPSNSRPENSGLKHSEKKQKWIDIYFVTFHPHWPFIHRGTFDMRQETPLLLQSMIAIGMWTSGEQSAQSAAMELFDKLDVAIRDQTEKWDASEVEEACSGCFWPIATYQALLLHVILAVMIKTDRVINLDLKASIPTTELQLLKSLIGSCRKLGMFFYPNMLSKFKETDLPPFVWVGIEEVKRFNLALYRLCTKLSNSSVEGGSLLHARELQFPKPSNDGLWNSIKKDDWEANAKEENMVSFGDDLQERWLSRHADAIEFLCF